MKLAIVCDDLIQKGGAEKIVEAMSDLFPEAPIYTSVASSEWLEKYKKKNREVKTSFLQKFPFSEKINRYYSPFLLHILAFESFDFSNFDVVLSSSSRYAHFIVTKPETKHICYMHSPGRMFWEPFDYFESEGFGILKPLKFLAGSFLKLPLSYIRMADLNASKKVDVFLANSKTSQRRIKKYYRRDSKIVYPFIDFEKFSDVKPELGNYFLIITRLSSWKKVEIAISACEKLGENLKIIGEGPDLKRLKSMSGPNTEFLGYVSEEEKIETIRNCKAVIITQKEDFGIVPLEAMACGKPVIAFGAGGALETVLQGRAGEFFEEQKPLSLEKTLLEFDADKYDSDLCKSRASDFDRKIFEEEIRKAVDV
jgi:glycosyltransferase involved in cell wall biosynthesis